MRLIWTLLKVAIALAIAVPVGLLAFALVGALVGLAVRVAVMGLIAYIGYRVFRRLMGAPAKPQVRPVSALPPADPYYQAALRELDAEIGKP